MSKQKILSFIERPFSLAGTVKGGQNSGMGENLEALVIGLVHTGILWIKRDRLRNFTKDCCVSYTVFTRNIGI